MVISEYIKALQAIQEEHGDLEVNKYDFRGHRKEDVLSPEIAFKKILTGRQWAADFWYKHLGEEVRGEKVVRI